MAAPVPPRPDFEAPLLRKLVRGSRNPDQSRDLGQRSLTTRAKAIAAGQRPPIAFFLLGRDPVNTPPVGFSESALQS
jgi:hypothetical protein